MIYYTVYDKNGNKLADCGGENDAKWLAELRKGTYKTNRLEWNRTIDVKTSKLELPTKDIIVNMDGGVGGSWTVESSQLNENKQQPFEV